MSMVKYGTCVIFVSKSNSKTKITIPLHNEELIDEFEKSAEWVREEDQYELKETCQEV
jgi:hypothetical protein